MNPCVGGMAVIIGIVAAALGCAALLWWIPKKIKAKEIEATSVTVVGLNSCFAIVLVGLFLLALGFLYLMEVIPFWKPP